MHQLVHRDLAAEEFLLAQVEDDLREDVAGGILDEDLVRELGIAENPPAGSFLVRDVLGVVDDTGRAPHAADGVVVAVLVPGLDPVEASVDVGRDVDGIVGRIAEIVADRQQEIGFEHLLDDVVRRADDIVIFVVLLDPREHELVDVEGVVLDLDVLARLLLVPLLKIFDDRRIDVIGPIIDAQDLVAWPVATAGQPGNDGQCDGDPSEYPRRNHVAYNFC